MEVSTLALNSDFTGGINLKSGSSCSENEALYRPDSSFNLKGGELGIQDNKEHTSMSTSSRDDIQIIPSDMIPLHAGSNVYVGKSDLVRIFTLNPLLYTSRLADLIFSQTLCDVSLQPAKDRLSLLDQTRLNSFITHIVQVFVRRGVEMNEEMVKKFMRQKMNRIRQRTLR